MMKYLLFFVCLLSASCKAKKHSESEATITTQLERVELATRQIAIQHEGDVETLQTWELFDSLGRIRERRTTERKARTETKSQATARTETELKQATQIATKHESKSEHRAGIAPPLWLMALAFALGIALSGYIAWRWLIRR